MKGHEKETIIAVSKRLEEHVPQDKDPEKQSRPETPPEIIKKSSPESPIITPEKPQPKSPPTSPKPSIPLTKRPPSSPKLDLTSPKLPPKIPRSARLVSDETVTVERPVELKRTSSTQNAPAKQSHMEGDVDSPVPPSTNTSSKHSAEKEPLVAMPITLSNPPSPISTPKSLEKEDNTESHQHVKPPWPTKRASTSPSKRTEKKGDFSASAKRESLPQIAMVEPSPPAPALGISFL